MRLYIFTYLVASRLDQLHRGTSCITSLSERTYEEGRAIGLAYVGVDTTYVEPIRRG